MMRVGMGHLELDALRRLDRHGVRVAERQLEVAALQQRAVADALDLKRLGEAGGDALDHVGDQRARQPMQGPVLGAVGRARDEQVAVLLDDLDGAVLALLEVASRPVHAYDLRLHRDGDGRGDGDGLSTDAGHECGYQTSATSSPPTPAARASWPVMTPCEVDRIVVPMPPRTFGMFLRIHVASLTGTGYPAQAGDHRSPVISVLQPHEDLVGGAAGHARSLVEALDVALLREDPRHLALEPAGGDLHRLMRGHDAVADTGQEVGDRVGHRHAITSSTSSCRG